MQARILDRDEQFELIGGEIVPIIARWLMQRLPDTLDVGVELTTQSKDKALFDPDVLVFAPRSRSL